MINYNWYNKIGLIKIAQYSNINDNAVKLFILYNGKKSGAKPNDTQEVVQQKAKNQILNIRKQILSGDSYFVNDNLSEKYLKHICQNPQGDMAQRMCSAFRSNPKNVISINTKVTNIKKMQALIQWYNYLQPQSKITEAQIDPTLLKDAPNEVITGLKSVFASDSKNEILSANPSFCYLIMQDLIKYSDKTKMTQMPMALNSQKLMSTYDAMHKIVIKQDSSGKVSYKYRVSQKNKQTGRDQIVDKIDNLNMGKLYQQALAGRLQQQHQSSEGKNKTGWIHIKGSDLVSKQQLNENITESARLGQLGGWCLASKSMSQSRLQNMDLYYLVENGDPKIAVNVRRNGSIYQLQGKGNSDVNLMGYLDQMQEFINSHPEINFQGDKTIKYIRQKKIVIQKAKNNQATVNQILRYLKQGQFDPSMNQKIIDAYNGQSLDHMPFDRFPFMLKDPKIVSRAKGYAVQYLINGNTNNFQQLNKKFNGIFTELTKDPEAAEKASENAIYMINNGNIHSLTRINDLFHGAIIKNENVIRSARENSIQWAIGGFKQNFDSINVLFNDIFLDILQQPQNIEAAREKGIEYLSNAYVQNFNNLNQLFDGKFSDLTKDPEAIRGIKQTAKQWIDHSQSKDLQSANNIFDNKISEDPQLRQRAKQSITKTFKYICDQIRRDRDRRDDNDYSGQIDSIKRMSQIFNISVIEQQQIFQYIQYFSELCLRSLTSNSIANFIGLNNLYNNVIQKDEYVYAQFKVGIIQRMKVQKDSSQPYKYLENIFLKQKCPYLYNKIISDTNVFNLASTQALYFIINNKNGFDQINKIFDGKLSYIKTSQSSIHSAKQAFLKQIQSKYPNIDFLKLLNQKFNKVLIKDENIIKVSKQNYVYNLCHGNITYYEGLDKLFDNIFSRNKDIKKQILSDEKRVKSIRVAIKRSLSYCDIQRFNNINNQFDGAFERLLDDKDVLHNAAESFLHHQLFNHQIKTYQCAKTLKQFKGRLDFIFHDQEYVRRIHDQAMKLQADHNIKQFDKLKIVVNGKIEFNTQNEQYSKYKYDHVKNIFICRLIGCEITYPALRRGKRVSQSYSKYPDKSQFSYYKNKYEELFDKIKNDPEVIQKVSEYLIKNRLTKYYEDTIKQCPLSIDYIRTHRQEAVRQIIDDNLKRMDKHQYNASSDALFTSNLFGGIFDNQIYCKCVATKSYDLIVKITGTGSSRYEKQKEFFAQYPQVQLTLLNNAKSQLQTYVNKGDWFHYNNTPFVFINELIMNNQEIFQVARQCAIKLLRNCDFSSFRTLNSVFGQKLSNVPKEHDIQTYNNAKAKLIEMANKYKSPVSQNISMYIQMYNNVTGGRLIQDPDIIKLLKDRYPNIFGAQQNTTQVLAKNWYKRII